MNRRTDRSECADTIRRPYGFQSTDDIDNCVDRLADGKNTSRPHYDTFSIVSDKRAVTDTPGHERVNKPVVELPTSSVLPAEQPTVVSSESRPGGCCRDKVSLATVDGRVECEYDLPDGPDGTPHGEFLLNDGGSVLSSTVHYDSEADEFCLCAAMERERGVSRPEKAEHSNVLGVDCRVDDHITVPSTGAFVGKANCHNHHRREFEKRRASLQQTGTRNTHLAFQRISDGFGREAGVSARWGATDKPTASGGGS